MLSDTTFAKLVAFSGMTPAEQEDALKTAQPQEIQEYLVALDSLGRLELPAPSASKKWQGRALLLEAASEYDAPQATSFSFPWLKQLQGATMALGVAVLTFSAFGAGMVAAGVRDSNGTFSEVLSALGLRTQEEPELPSISPRPAQELPVFNPDFNPGFEFAPPAPTDDEEADENSDDAQEVQTSPATPGESEQPIVSPPGQGGENPGQGVEPPGQGGDPPGQGGENPGQGVDPPGQGGENPGQGVDPPGQGGENPGQGAEPPGQGGENPGQGGEPPGQGGENPGQGNGNPGQGGENPGQGGGGGKKN